MKTPVTKAKATRNTPPYKKSLRCSRRTRREVPEHENLCRINGKGNGDRNQKI